MIQRSCRNHLQSVLIYIYIYIYIYLCITWCIERENKPSVADTLITGTTTMYLP